MLQRPLLVDQRGTQGGHREVQQLRCQNPVAGAKFWSGCGRRFVSMPLRNAVILVAFALYLVFLVIYAAPQARHTDQMSS